MQQTNPFLWLVGFIILALIAREIVCWYWKMNEVVSLLRASNDLHAKTNEILGNLAGSRQTDGYHGEQPNS